MLIFIIRHQNNWSKCHEKLP